MQLTTVIVTRNKSATVKTMHTILKLNVKCMERGIHNQIIFVADEEEQRKAVWQKHVKLCDRVLWIDYGITFGDEAIDVVCSKDWQWHGVVFPCVKEGIDWKRFKETHNSTEPVHQRGLHFDTEVDKRVKDDFWTIKSTRPKCFVVDSKQFLKNSSKKVLNIDELIHSKFRMVAFTAATVTNVYPHECLGNILNAAGVKAN